MAIQNQNVIDTLNSRDVNDKQLHSALCIMLGDCNEASKRDIVNSPELREVFSHPVMARVHMRQCISWFEEFTPIRPRFKGNGQFEKIGFAKKPVWNLEGAKAEPWYTFEAKQVGKAAKGDISKGVNALAREVARVAFATNTLGSSAAQAKQLVESELIMRIVEEMQSERFAKWATAYTAQREQEQREAKQEQGEKSAEVLAAIDAARAAGLAEREAVAA